MLHRDPLAASLPNRVRHVAGTAAGEVIRWSWDLYRRYGAIGPRSATARTFGSFGEGSIVNFPYESIVNPAAIHLGRDTVVARNVTLSAGWMPDQPDLGARVLVIGDRCLIGQGSTLVAHRGIEIGDDVWTGHNVHVVDMNHGYLDPSLPISRQHQPEAPVVVGDGSWLGHHVVVLPGVRIGRNVVVGAGSIVVDDLADHTVAVGAPARVVHRHDARLGWVRTADEVAATPT
jgi:serine acetyltransferase